MEIKGHPYLFQWDMRRELLIQESGAAYVDFARTLDFPLRVAIVGDTARIPDSWLQVPGVRAVYVCYTDGTICKHLVEVHPRQMPPTYVLDENDGKYNALQTKIQGLIDEVKTGIDSYIEDYTEGVANGVTQPGDESATVIRTIRELSSEIKNAGNRDKENYADAVLRINAFADEIDQIWKNLNILKSIQTDALLQTAGARADAKAVGESINKLKKTVWVYPRESPEGLFIFQVKDPLVATESGLEVM
nr:MAG TPA: hypothetical protein [Caudoviricetes sp.]